MRRSLFGLLAALATITGRTTALEASVVVFGSGNKGEFSTVSGATLQQLLELRSESSTTSTFESSDQNSVEVLEKLAGSPHHLFGAPVTDGELDTVMVILEGLSGYNGALYQNEYKCEVLKSTFATAAARDDFADHLSKPHTERIFSAKRRHFSLHNSDNNDYDRKDFVQTCLPSSLSFESLGRTLSTWLLREASAGECWVNDQQGTLTMRVAFEAETRSTSENELKSLFSDLHLLTLNGKKTTVVILSDSMATPKSSHSRRASVFDEVDRFSHRDMGSQSVAFQQRGNIPLSLAPVCYVSNSSCNDATDICSGHGTCYEKSSDCYACRCYETVVKSQGGLERKIRWGGSACQKQDISSPFFLITGVTVAIIIAISTAVGMIFRVGTADLPGVISAGVGAAKAQK
ncbi:hypothetical protein BDV06DRAFT_188436 [Aspergillus oleicola]